MDASLLPVIALGYHSHNNFQLFYANAAELVEQFTQREMIVDCSVMGMGKGAGNAATELMALYINNYWEGNYDVDQILEIADTYIEKEKKKNDWGYSLKYYIAASNHCHPKYVSFLLDKKTLSIKSINQIISKIALEKLTKYDEQYISSLYREYQEKCIDDRLSYANLREKVGSRPVLMLAPGRSLLEEKEAIESFIKENNPYVISINHYSQEIYRTDAVFVSNHKRYSQIALRMKKYPSTICVIATSNINPTTLHVDICLNYSSLLVDDITISDNATLLLLNAMIAMGIQKVTLAGFDGYRETGGNYFNDGWDFMGQPWLQNEAIRKIVKQMKKKISFKFLTKSLYE